MPTKKNTIKGVKTINKLSAVVFNGEAYINIPSEINEIHILRAKKGEYTQEVRISLTPLSITSKAK